MIQGITPHARWAARRLAGAAAHAAALALAGLAVIAAITTTPARAAQQPHLSAASHPRPATTGQHRLTGPMTPGPNWAHVSAGYRQTCAIRADTTLWCWGDNGLGQLGIGSHGPTGQDLPRQVTTPAAGGWASISGGANHTCATRTDGTLWCWGGNLNGQLGIGSHGPTSQDLPRQVTTPAAGGWASVSAGDNHTCATRTDGTLWCWGDDHYGQIGIGSHTDQDLPRQVTFPRPGGWASSTAGSIYTCATRTDATLWCWGDNGYGQLGTGDHTNRYRPHQVTTPALGGWASVTADVTHTCATRTDTTLWCWGSNDDGELGIGNGSDQDLPQQVRAAAPGGWASVSAGSSYTCATRTGATLWCWGASGDGSLGIGHVPNQHLPQQVRTPAPGGWASITAGFGQTCAIRTGATLWCWGFNGYGQLGTGNHTSQWRPQEVTGCRQMTLSPPAPTSALPPPGQAASPGKHRAPTPAGATGNTSAGRASP
jgi:alpha-tubulin suppressor-like RCC1 family protein